MSTQINRRKALTVVAAAPAAVALATPALGSVGEDAELLRLWKEYKAQYERWTAAFKFMSQTEEKVGESWSPYWRFENICKGRTAHCKPTLPPWLVASR
jgi:hypothetical protein